MTYHVHSQRLGFAPDHDGYGLTIAEAQAHADAAAMRLGDAITDGTAHVGIYDERAHTLTLTHGAPILRPTW